MEKYKISYTPREVPLIKTKFRKIGTKIPVPKSLSIFEDLEKYEARSMHGQLPIVWDRAEEFQVFDKYGNCWIDFTSTIFLANSGHANPCVASAIKEAVDKKLLHTYTFANEYRVKFLKKLIEMIPRYLEKAFLMSSGTEATECALKLMRMYGQTINPKKNKVISFLGNMHGRTMGAEMLKGDPNGSSWIGYKDPSICHLNFPYPWNPREFNKEMEELKKKEKFDAEEICGFIIEAYQGWGAVFYPKEYIRELCAFAKEHKALVAFDEIQGGFGRTGKLFVYQHYDVEPDLVCLGKAISGSLPLSAVVGKSEILDLPEIGSMSSTHSANPLCCAAGLANLEEIEKNKLVEESARKGEILHYLLNKIKEKFPSHISHILGKGLLAAIITTNPKTHQPDGLIASKVCERAMQKGLLLVHTGRESIKIGPPLTIKDEALVEGIGVIEDCFREVIKE
ncbi:MAG: aspartate aminotransferase family protein [Candidatus Staskawiczbacteria bacterium]|jgi:4-aminobutyrate aminotransferase-like enzyme